MRPDPWTGPVTDHLTGPLTGHVAAAPIGELARHLACEARRLTELCDTPALQGPCGLALRRSGAGLAESLAALAWRAGRAAAAMR